MENGWLVHGLCLQSCPMALFPHTWATLERQSKADHNKGQLKHGSRKKKVWLVFLANWLSRPHFLYSEIPEQKALELRVRLRKKFLLLLELEVCRILT